ncbi:MAG: SUF system Fe-S cluster assembly protein [Sphingomonadaceae bacterium]|uniref:SUF system Fe-S cluster assembly protein n=1 Tax=Thermaurantiacus sp. TaxID=2820283 RepID=UPI00298F268A|nr:SUF system Fe-S cluster assembly protein [Thermaurantiacus sp.]MCS6987084.1 SUF system Fe-S cluster assembly protein [Sphingomonadaceae bacterium]MDW8415578.1 SUF system Fe-S cluster assembly protein [Thermaurantiacus sp.]
MSDQEPAPRRFTVELVDHVESPPRQPPLAAPEPASPPRDFLEGFLRARPDPAPEAAPASEGDAALKDAVIAALREIYDPEIPVNIYDLGLVYGVEVAEGHVAITMTLTTPHCPVAESLPGEVEMRVLAVPGVATCEVNLVWDPPWSPAAMSDEAKLELGML